MINQFDAADVLQKLYDSEINVYLATFWDAGWEWRLGDHMNGFQAEGNCRRLDDAVRELADAARKHYPRSLFATGVMPTEFVEANVKGGA